MELIIFGDAGQDAEISAFWWCCVNNNGRCDQIGAGFAIAAPEYDWLYWYKCIPRKDLNKDPELKAEWKQAKEAYSNRRRGWRRGKR